MHATSKTAANGDPVGGGAEQRSGFAAKSVLIYSAGILAGKLASVILVPLYTHRLSQADYGILDLLDTTLQAATKLLWGGFTYAFWYFYSNAPAEQRNRTVSTAIWGALLLGLCGAVFGGIAAPGICSLITLPPQSVTLLRILFVSLLCAFPFEIVLSWFRVNDRPVQYVAAGIFRLALHAGSALFLMLVLGLGLKGVVISTLTAGMLSAGFVITQALRKNGLGFDARLFGRMMAFSSPAIFVGICSFTINFGDRYFLKRWVPLADLGVYALAYKFGMLITLLQYGFQGYWNAQVFRIATLPSGAAVVGRALTYLTLVLSAACLAITAFAGPAIALVAPAVYAPSVPLVPLICCAYAVFGVAAFFQTLFYVKKRPGADAMLSGAGAAVALLGYALLIPRFHLWGAGIATLASFLTTLVIAAVWVRKLMVVNYERARLLKATVPAAVLMALRLALPASGALAEIALGVGLVLAYAAALLFTRFADDSERRWIAERYRRLRKTGAARKTGTDAI